MRKLLGIACWTLVTTTVSVQADPVKFTLSDTVSPAFSTNPYRTEPSVDAPWLSNGLSAIMDNGTTGNWFDYRFQVGGQSARYYDQSAANADALTTSARISKAFSSTRFSIFQVNSFSYTPFYDDLLLSTYDLGGSISHRFDFPGTISVTPVVTYARRWADVATAQRQQAAGAVEFRAPLLHGGLTAVGAYAYRWFDEDGRVDNNLTVNLQWLKELDRFKGVSLGLRSSVERNWSNAPGKSFSAFEVGPIMTISFASR